MSENTPLLSVDLPAELRQRQSELAQLLLKHCPSDGVYGTAVDPLALIRADGPTLPARGMHKPALCIIAQGRKEVQLAEERYIYDPLHYLVVSVTLPLAGQVIDASPDAPYLCVRLDIDPAEITQLISDAGPMEVASRRGDRGLYVDRIDASLLDAVLRLIHLLDSPRDIPMLAPLILREIFYRLLRSDRASACTRSPSPTARPTASPAPSTGSTRTTASRCASSNWPRWSTSAPRPCTTASRP